MRNPVVFVLLAIGLLQFKHFLCDFIFQTARHAQWKGVYGHPAGLQHSGIHAFGTIPCLLIVGVMPLMAVSIAMAEFVVHYHADWAKEQITRRAKWTPADHMFWNALGADQLIHHFTYLAIVSILLQRYYALF
jgi:Protein of unknown function (DUF3307)